MTAAYSPLTRLLLEVPVSVIAGSEDDINLRILLNSKKGSFRFLPGSIPDMTTLMATLPDGGRTVLSNGTIIKGPAIDTIQNTGRRKGNTYTSVFGSYPGTQLRVKPFLTLSNRCWR
ncbi:tail fiber protein [Pseudomonas phage WP1]